MTVGMAANAQTLLNEGFDNGIPSTWTMFNDNNTAHNSSQSEAWSVSSNYGNPAPGVVSASWFNTAAQADRWLITDSITIPSTGYVFSLEAACFEAAYPDGFMVKVSNTDRETRASFTETILSVSAATDEFEEYSASLDAFVGQTIYIAVIQNSNDMNFLIADNFKIYMPAADEVMVTGISYPSVSETGDVNGTVTVRNRGTHALASFDVSVTVNGNVEHTATVNGLSVAYNQEYTYSIPALHLTNAGTYSIEVTVSNPNGVSDPTPDDNSISASVMTYDPASVVGRRTVLEHFTTAQCPNCPSGHTRIGNAVSGKEDRVVWIAHHVGYYTDDMTISASQQLMSLYNDGGSTYAPASMLDRDNSFADADDPGPVFFPGSDIASRVANAIATPAFVTCDFSDISYDASSRKVTATVSGHFTADMDFDSPRLTMYIMEDGIMGSQSGASGQYEHNHVIRAAISNVWGDADAITSTNAWDEYSKTFTYTLPDGWNADKCWVAAFVNNYSN